MSTDPESENCLRVAASLRNLWIFQTIRPHLHRAGNIDYDPTYRYFDHYNLLTDHVSSSLRVILKGDCVSYKLRVSIL